MVSIRFWAIASRDNTRGYGQLHTHKRCTMYTKYVTDKTQKTPNICALCARTNDGKKVHVWRRKMYHQQWTYIHMLLMQCKNKMQRTAQNIQCNSMKNVSTLARKIPIGFWYMAETHIYSILTHTRIYSRMYLFIH